MSQGFSPIAGNEDYTKTGMVSQVPSISAGEANVGNNLTVGGHINGCMTFHTVVGYMSAQELASIPNNSGGLAYLRTEPGITTPPTDEDDRTILFPSKAIIFECVATHGGNAISPTNAGISIGPTPFGTDPADIAANFNPGAPIIGLAGTGTSGRINDGIAITYDPVLAAQNGGTGSRGGYGDGTSAVGDSVFAIVISNANAVTSGDLKVRISYVMVPTPAENNGLYATGIYGTV